MAENNTRSLAVTKKAAALALALTLAACGEPTYPKYEVDRARWNELFLQCMAALPAGPQETQYNDWAEVVEECRTTGYKFAVYCYANCPPESAAVRKEDANG